MIQTVDKNDSAINKKSTNVPKKYLDITVKSNGIQRYDIMKEFKVKIFLVIY